MTARTHPVGCHKQRRQLTEAQGIPVAVVVDDSNRNDFKMARDTIEAVATRRPRPTQAEPQGLCLEKGYDFDEVRALAREFRFTAHIRCRGEEARAIKRRARFSCAAVGRRAVASLDESISKDSSRARKSACGLLG